MLFSFFDKRILKKKAIKIRNGRIDVTEMSGLLFYDQ